MRRPGCTIIGTVVAKPEKRGELLKILAAQVDPTRSEPGNINYNFHCDKNNPNIFVFYENFVDQAALDSHLKMPYLKPLMSRLEELVAEPVDIRHLELLCDLV